ncbi:MULTISPECIES: hypothetical protein [Rhizobium]|nr:MULTISPECIES: hypothetical protein [Rhizobium]
MFDDIVGEAIGMNAGRFSIDAAAIKGEAGERHQPALLRSKDRAYALILIISGYNLSCIIEDFREKFGVLNKFLRG